MEILEKGTTLSKTSSTTLAINDVEICAGSGALVGIGYETGSGAPTSVKLGNRSLSQLVVQAQSGMAVAWWVLRHINNTKTRNLVATWGSAVTAKAMLVVEVDGTNVLDVSQKNGQAATTNPATGTAVTTTAANTAHLALFGSRGPVEDAAGTVGNGHTSGQRVGTTGGAATSNVTIHQTWELLTATGNTRATKSGATSRTWANVIVALKLGRRKGHSGLSPTDFMEVGEKFDSMSKDVDKAVFWFSQANSRWEVYEDDRLSTMIAHQDNGWA